MISSGFNKIRKYVVALRVLLFLILVLLLVLLVNIDLPISDNARYTTRSFNFPVDPTAGFSIIDGLESTTGLIAQGDWLLVKQNCTPCHSAKLVTQNHADKAGWMATIDWMQETQGLWDLGDNEFRIVNYLTNFYGYEKVGRRKPLEIEEWYDIE